jgi:MFS transporter, ACS family, glucarate transporter
VCLDIGGKYAGAVTGAFNTASQVGSLVSSVAFGYLVNRTGSYDVPFIPMAVLLVIGALLWLKIDPARELIPGIETVSKTALPVDLG